MKKWFCFLCMSLILAMEVTAPVKAREEYSVTALTGEATIQAESLNVRSGPSKEYDAVGKAKKGEVYGITGQASNGWYEIDYKGSRGYISDEYAVLTEAPEEDGQSGAAEGGGGFAFDWEIYGTYVIGAVVILITLVIFVSIIVTVRKMIAGDEYEDDEQEDAEDGEDEDTAEEDYRVYIDPRYFEDNTPGQNETPVGEPADAGAPKDGANDPELEAAMEKINELQRELERMKEKRK